MSLAVSRILLIPVISLLLVVISGCASSSTPSVSGFGLGNDRVVSRGDEVVILLPASSETGRSKWRLTSFDSRMLTVTQTPRLEATGSSGRPQWTVRFVARTPGETEVVLTRNAVGSDGVGTVGERMRFKITILE
jgi:predicted secreted protein